MRLIKTYYEEPIEKKFPQEIILNDESSHHLLKVLRLKENSDIAIINNSNGYYIGKINSIIKKKAHVLLESFVEENNESPLKIHLGQVISRSDRMEFTIMKAVELGVDSITPLFSARCDIKLSEDRLLKKMEHWQKIIINACIQSNRNVIPKLHPAINLKDWLQQETNDIKLNINPTGNLKLKNLNIQDNKHIRLLIGSESGLTTNEIEIAQNNSYLDIVLGKRILRTETAALTVISILQSQFGDL